MKVRVLGCSGGIGDGRHTTSFLVDDDILIDCGTGVSTLTHAELCRVEHVFVTHAHLDHILCLPLLLDSTAGERTAPVIIHALPAVLDVLRKDIFNWRIWPDFAVLPSEAAPFMRYAALELHAPVQLGARVIEAIPANHVVPAVGYALCSPQGALLFSGDSCGHAGFWQYANAVQGQLQLMVECSFEDALREIALASKHYCAATLAADLGHLTRDAQVWVTHLKPGGEAPIMAELLAHGASGLKALQQGQILEV
jgi:ribonuclease BN (tRNA processing enzyme)